VRLWHHVLVEPDEPVYGPLPDLQRGEVGQEVVAHEEAHEDPVINSPLRKKGSVHGEGWSSKQVGGGGGEIDENEGGRKENSQMVRRKQHLHTVVLPFPSQHAPLSGIFSENCYKCYWVKCYFAP